MESGTEAGKTCHVIEAFSLVFPAEIGATAKSPAIKTMKYGIIMGYCTIVSAYLCVSITGENGLKLGSHIPQGFAYLGDLNLLIQ